MIFSKERAPYFISKPIVINEIDINNYADFYYLIIFNINENNENVRDAAALELKALEYHIRAMATPKGVTELENQLNHSLAQIQS